MKPLDGSAQRTVSPRPAADANKTDFVFVAKEPPIVGNRASVGISIACYPRTTCKLGSLAACEIGCPGDYICAPESEWLLRLVSATQSLSTPVKRFHDFFSRWRVAKIEPRF